MEKESIQMNIAKTAAENWRQPLPNTLEESLKITWDSEVAAVQGIKNALNLDESMVEKLVGTKDENGQWKRDGEIYNRETLSQEVSSIMKQSIENANKNVNILDILSTIHDAWVKNNSNNFLKPERNKERQFVPLPLLDWGEVESDLLFLKPILEGADIKIDESQLKEEFEVRQAEYMANNGIFSQDDLEKHLKQKSFYSVLNGLETKNGGIIKDLLKNDEIIHRMAQQISSKVEIKSREQLAMDIIKSETPSLDNVLWLETVENDFKSQGWNAPNLSDPISKREAILSKCIGHPYPDYFINERAVHPATHDCYKNELREPKDDEKTVADNYKSEILNRKQEAINMSDPSLDTLGVIELNTRKDIIKNNEEQHCIKLSKRDLLKAGLKPEKLGFKEISRANRRKIRPKEIAEAEGEYGITTTHVNKIKEFFTRLLNKLKGNEK